MRNAIWNGFGPMLSRKRSILASEPGYGDELLLRAHVPHEHRHCVLCFNGSCQKIDGCALIHCPFCNVNMHCCKLEDHLGNICPKASAQCPNVAYGCSARMRRHKINDHLEHCPASIVRCPSIRNRQFISEKAKKMLKQIAKGRCTPLKPLNEEIIASPDIALTQLDQAILLKFFSLQRSKRLHHLSAICRRDLENVATVESNENARDRTNDDGMDSSEEEEKAQELRFRAIREPFSGCRLCRLDPGTQHLHELGNLRTALTNDEQSQTDELDGIDEAPHQQSKDPLEFLPVFYRERALLLSYDISFTSIILDSGFIRSSNFRKFFPIFSCQEFVRRDQYSTHYATHMALEDCGCPFIARCPNAQYGCPFQMISKQTLPINGGIIRFNHFLGCSAFVPMPQQLPPSPTSSGLFLSDLSPHFFSLLASKLDDATLRSLSSTCHRLRSILSSTLGERMGIELRWKKKDGNIKENGVQKYEQCGLRRFFGITQSLPKLIVQPLGQMIDHLQDCQFGESYPLGTERVDLHKVHGISPDDCNRKDN